MSAPPVSLSRLTDPELHAEGGAHALWLWMREHAPVHWTPGGELPGFWSLTRYDDVRAAYRDPRTFSSAHGVLLRPLKYGEDPGGGLTLALTDPPRHRQLRGLMRDRFTERAARSLEPFICETVGALLARAIELGECDFAHDVAARLTLYVIAHVMGAPGSDHEALYLWTHEAFEAGKPLATHLKIMQYFIELMDRRETAPGDDLVSDLVHGETDGEPLSEEELLLNFENLVGAAENAGLSMAGGMLAFLEHPEQWQRLHEEPSLLPSAVEEVLRWTSSATHSMRTVRKPTVFGDQRLRQGDRVVLWLPSANRDARAFPDAERFDVGRRPNRHLALGIGEHFCIGNALARTQMSVLFSQLLAGVRVEQIGASTRLRSIVVSGPAELPVRMRANGALGARGGRA